MNILPVNNVNFKSQNPSFGHSFRVSICLKDEFGNNKFVNPSADKKLYKHLNSKIVNWLNEDYYTKLRQFLGIKRKIESTKPSGNNHKQLIENLKNLDYDYRKFNHARSVYNGQKLGYIVTGTDVSIIENLKAAKFIGTAKSDSKRYSGVPVNDYVKNLTKLVKKNMLEYAQNTNILLRSPNDKEIMLKAIFKKTGKNKSGTPNYELDGFEFHENKTKQTLPPVNENFIRYKYNPAMDNEIKTTVKYHADKLTGKAHSMEQIDKFFK